MTSYANASSETSNDNSSNNSNDNTKRNKKTQALSALLSATALGMFLEGCGGDTPAVLGSESNPFLATAGADVFDGSAGADWVSYAGSDAGVTVDLGTPANNEGWAQGDILTGIQNIIGSAQGDTLTGNLEANSLRGGGGVDILSGGGGSDILYGGAGGDTLNGGAGDDSYIFASGHGVDMIEIDADGGKLLFRAAASFDAFSFVRDNNNVKITVGGDSVEILSAAYADGRYILHHGTNDEILGALITGGTFTGGDEKDVIIGTAQAETLTGGVGGDTIDGGEGTDTVSYSGAGVGVRVDISSAEKQVDFTRENGFATNQNEAVGDTLSNIENIEGSAHADWLAGDGKDNTLRGGEGDDTISGNAGVDTLYGGVGNDRLIGNAGVDTLYGGVGDDRLDGGVGNDRLNGGTGGDTIDGGAGTDTVSYSSSSKGVRVALSLTGAQQDFDGTNNIAANQNEAVDDILSGIEHIEGSAHVDWLTGDGFANTLTGGAGNDILEGGEGEDTYIFRVGHGADVITDAVGNTMTLRFIGSQYVADDFKEERTSGDPLFARDSNNNLVISIDKASDGITDKVTINDAFDTGVDLLYTINVEYVNDEGSLTPVTEDYWSNLKPVLGSEGNPYEATAGNDPFTGSAGADWVSYAKSLAEVRIFLSNDDDTAATVSRGATGDTLINIQNIIGSGNNDIFSGNNQANVLQGNAGNDLLIGNAGVDTLYGGANKDQLNGGAGDDKLYGDGGADIYSFRIGDGTDQIYDVEGDTMTLLFVGDEDDYVEGDFTNTANFARVGNNLVISIDKDDSDSITDQVTINNAFDTDSNTGTGNAAFTINVEYGVEGRSTFNEVALANSFWHNFAA